MESNSNQLAINNGLYIGGISTILGILVYYVSPDLMGATSFGIIMMLLSLALLNFALLISQENSLLNLMFIDKRLNFVHFIIIVIF